MLPYALERQIAIKAVEHASILCQKVFKNLVKESHILKSDKSPVTIADYGSQCVINTILAQHFPSDPIVGEEDANELRNNADLAQQVLDLVNSVPNMNMKLGEMLTSIDRGNYTGGRTGRFWTLDPIDGTKGFLRGDQYAVCLALIDNGQVQVGVLGCPNLPRSLAREDQEVGCIYASVRGQGAFEILATGERPIGVSNTIVASESLFCESYESSHSSQDDTARVSKQLGITRPPLRMDSQCKYAVLARGDAEIYMRFPDYDQNIWDHAAGALIVKEAGGHITDTNGKELDFGAGIKLYENKGIVGTNGRIHHSVLDAIRESGSSKM